MGGQSFLPTEILDYVGTHAPQEGSPYGVSQRELAKSLGYHPCSMSRPLGQLVEDGLLSTRRGPVRDGIRKQLVYRITEAGKSHLARETKRVPLLPGAIPPPPNPFIGRRSELDQLVGFATNGGAITLIEGPPGIGKTALISRHLRRVRRGRIPFWFTIRPASSARQFVTALSHALAFLGSPQLAYYTQLPRPPVPREVADLTARALGDRELVAVIDDFQMADPSLRGFLEEFLGDLVRGRSDQLYVVGQETPVLSAEGIPVHRLSVGGLDRAAAHDLTDRRGGLADRFESVFQSTLGSPLLLQLAVSNPELEADATTLPSKVVERLAPADVRALLPVAVSNEPLPLQFIVDRAGMSAARLQDVFRMGVVQRTSQGRVEMLQVVRSALLRLVGPKDESAAHLSLADFYSGSHQPEAIRERFLHLVSGGAWKQAAQVLLQQERNVLALGYSDTLRNGIRSLAASIPKGPTRVKVLLIEASVLRYHSDYALAIDSVRQAIEESNGDPKTSGEGLLTVVELLTRLRRVDEATAEFQKAEEIGPITRRLQAFLVLSRARILQARGEIHAARSMFQDAFDLARRYRVTDLALEGIAGWSRLEELEGGPEPALRIIERALPEARKAGRNDIAFNLRLIRARAYMRLNQTRIAEEEMRLVRAEAESLGYLNQLTYALNGLAAAAIEGARWGEAIAYAKQGCELAERLRNDIVLGHTLALLSAAELRQSVGSSERAELVRDSVVHGERSVEVLGRVPPSESLGLAHGYLAETYLAHGDRTRAVEHYHTAIEILEKLQIPWIIEMIQAELGAKMGLSADGKAAPESS